MKKESSMDVQNSKSPLYLIDGSGFIFRAFHALPPLSRQDGTPVGAVLGFCNMMVRLLDETENAHMAVVFDAKRHTFRHEIFPEYKSNRSDPPADLVPQFQIIREACTAFNLPQLEMVGFEADDLIATLAKKAKAVGQDVIIVSSDKDLMQLIEPGITMMDPIKYTPIGPDEVMLKFGVSPNRVIDIQSLVGDSSDFVPGVPGIGVKTAAELINRYGSLDALYDHVHEIPQVKRRETLIENKDKALLSRRLVTLKDDVPLEISLDTFNLEKPEPQSLLHFLTLNNFKNLVARLKSKGYLDDIQASRPKVEYPTVLNEKDLIAWCEKARQQGYVAFDTETTGLNPMQAQLVGVSLALSPGEACYIPVAHVTQAKQLSLLGDGDEVLDDRQLKKEVVLKHLKPLLENPAITVIGHNLKYDMHIMARYGLKIASFEDTMIMSYDLYGATHGHGMDELAQLYLSHQTITFKDVMEQAKVKDSFARVPLDLATAYAGEDADITLQLFKIFEKKLIEQKVSNVYETIDKPMVGILWMMEEKGIYIDPKDLADMSREFEERLGVLEKSIHALAGEPFAIASPKQLGEILFEKMAIPGGKKGKSGAYGTGADVLEELAGQGIELAEQVLDWRGVAKLKSTYSDALQNQINPQTGRLHTSYGLTVATTGRLSSSDPNLQNIPVRTPDGQRIRAAFKASPGNLLISLDYSQIELRLLAHFGHIPALLKAFQDNIDIHQSTASEVFGVPLDQVDPMLRRRAKAINFGIIYGISAFGLARQLKIGRTEAAEYIDRYFKRYPEIRDFMEAKKEEARTHGYVLTLFGRKCFVPGIKDLNGAVRAFAERQAINAPLQGTAADIIKKAMIAVPKALKRQNLQGDLLLQVHDELVLEAPHDYAQGVADAVRQEMEGVIQLTVPLLVDVGMGLTWRDAH